MKKYKLLNVTNDNALELQDVNGGRKAAYPNQVLYLPESGLFVFKKDMAFKNKIKSLITDSIALLVLIIFIFMVIYLYLTDEPSGYYRAKTYNDGTGIQYEWYEGGEQ